MRRAFVGLVVDKRFGGRGGFVFAMKLTRWPSGSITDKAEYCGRTTSPRWTLTNLGVTWICFAVRYLRSSGRLSVSKTTSANKFEGTGEGASNSATTCCEFTEKELRDIFLSPRT